MGNLRSGLLAVLVIGATAFAQDTNPVPNVPAPTPNPPLGADPNNPIAPPPGAVPENNPNLLPAATDTTAAPAAVDTTGAAAKPKAKKPAAPALPTLRGTASSIDRTNMTVTIQSKGKEETLRITGKTRIFADKKPAILSDVKDGESVVAEYHSGKDKSKEALSLRFGGPAATEKISSSGGETKPKPAAKKASKKKKSAKKTVAPTAAPELPTSPTPGTPDAATPSTAPGATPQPTPGTPTPGLPNPTGNP